MNKVTDFVNAIHAVKAGRIVLLTLCGGLLLLAYRSPEILAVLLK